MPLETDRKILEIDPNHKAASEFQAELEAQQRHLRKVKNAGACPPNGRKAAIATHTLARLYADQGLYPEAAAIYKKLLDADPSDRESRQGLDWLLEKLGEKGPSFIKREDALKKERQISRLQTWLDTIQREKRR